MGRPERGRDPCADAITIFRAWRGRRAMAGLNRPYRRIFLGKRQAGGLQNVTSAPGCGGGARVPALGMIVGGAILMTVHSTSAGWTPGRRPWEQVLPCTRAGHRMVRG